MFCSYEKTVAHPGLFGNEILVDFAENGFPTAGWKEKQPGFEVYRIKSGANTMPGRCVMKKEEEKKPIPWEIADPKPPVIQSGRFENRKQNDVM